MMNKLQLINKINGVQTIQSIMKILDINRRQAIDQVSKLRKAGYVKTRRISNGKRIYHISKQNLIGGMSYYDVINKYAPVKLSESQIYKIYGRDPSLEETLIYAIKTKKLRVILASLNLFKHIKNWNLLKRLSKKNHVEKIVGALYDLSRKIMKTRRMSEQTRTSCLPPKNEKFTYIISGLKSKDFEDIEETWKVYLPFNLKDFEDYGR